MDEVTLKKNESCIKEQLSQFLSFDDKFSNHAIIKNNYDWMKDFSFLDFIRDIRKDITINYMKSKDSVKNRIDSDSGSGMSFTEFTYQLVQGYDFLFLNREYNCSIQMGGSDQWGNITSGMELIRRIDNSKGYALTCPLITKSDGSKFGKSEGGNIWLDPKKTSAYKFYQYWLNSSDEDAKNYIKIFTFLDQNKIEELISEHNAEKASRVLFSKNFLSEINDVEETIFLDIFEGVTMAEIGLKEIKNGVEITKLLHEKTGFLSSNSEVKRALGENSIAVNKNKVDKDYVVGEKDLIKNKYIVVNRGKKKTFLIKAID